MGGVGIGVGVGGGGGAGGGHEEGKLFSLVIDLMDPNTREAALLELSKKREQYDDLAMILWHSFGKWLTFFFFFFF
jgi:CCR4-NOT transcription complex subunit 9